MGEAKWISQSLGKTNFALHAAGHLLRIQTDCACGTTRGRKLSPLPNITRIDDCDSHECIFLVTVELVRKHISMTMISLLDNMAATYDQRDRVCLVSSPDLPFRALWSLLLRGHFQCQRSTRLQVMEIFADQQLYLLLLARSWPR